MIDDSMMIAPALTACFHIHGWAERHGSWQGKAANVDKAKKILEQQAFTKTKWAAILCPLHSWSWVDLGALALQNFQYDTMSLCSLDD